MRTAPRSGMSIHRNRQSSRRSPHGGQVSFSDVGAVLTILQIVVCIVLLVTVFTLQFIDRDSYARTGELYRAVMSGEGEAVYVGAFGTPITKELLQDYAMEFTEPDRVNSPDAVTEEKPEKSAAGQGGETPYIPQNLYMGGVLLSAKPVYPVYGFITSPFGGRSHPITEKPDFHTGLDIAAKEGDSIYAILPGKVAEVGVSPIYGNYIRITHAQGLESVYNHCSEILAAEGAVVRAGERIALVGSTGVSTGAHLHLDLLVEGCYTDPMQVY